MNNKYTLKFRKVSRGLWQAKFEGYFVEVSNAGGRGWQLAMTNRGRDAYLHETLTFIGAIERANGLVKKISKPKPKLRLSGKKFWVVTPLFEALWAAGKVSETPADWVQEYFAQNR